MCVSWILAQRIRVQTCTRGKGEGMSLWHCTESCVFERCLEDEKKWIKFALELRVHTGAVPLATLVVRECTY